MIKLEKKAGPDHVGPGNHMDYFNFYSKVRGVSQKGIKQKSEMDCVHMIIFVF